MRRRRAIIVWIIGTVIMILLGGSMPRMVEENIPTSENTTSSVVTTGQNAGQFDVVEALEGLEKLAVKGRAPKTGFDRSQFGEGWLKVNGCSTRNIILYRDLEDVVLEDECIVSSGVLNDPYTGEVIVFSKQQSAEVQIDHVVALSDAWQKGAQALSPEERKRLANDPLELLAVSGKQNQEKSDGDAATWLPKNKAFRCQYVARQIEIKIKYTLWVTEQEKKAMSKVLQACSS